MSAGQNSKSATETWKTPAVDVRQNRYELYGSGEASNLENAKLKSPNPLGNPPYRQEQEQGVTLHIKEQTVYDSLNSMLTAQRPKSALLRDPSNSECSLFGVSLKQPLKYSRNVLTMTDAKPDNPRRRSSYSSDDTIVGRIKKDSKD